MLDEADDLRDGHDEQTIGFAQARSELGDKLAWRDADGTGDALLVIHRVPDALRDRRGAAEAADGAPHIEECLVEAQRFDDGRDAGEGLHDGIGHRGIEVVIGSEHGRLWAQPPGARHRHGGSDAEGAGFVGRGQHDAARAAADDDGAAYEVRAAEEGRGGKEGVHVDVEHRAAGVVGGAIARSRRGPELTPTHGGGALA